MQDGFSSEVNLTSLWWLQDPFLKKKQSLHVYTSGIMSPQASSSGFAYVYKSLPMQYGNSGSSSFSKTQSLQVYSVCSMLQQFYFVLNVKYGFVKVLDALLGICFASIHLILAKEILDSIPCIEVKVSANIQRLNTAQILQPCVMRRMRYLLCLFVCKFVHEDGNLR